VRRSAAERSSGSGGGYPVDVNRSLRAVLLGTFTLRFSTGLTGLALTFYLRDLHLHRGMIDIVLGLGPNDEVGPITFSVIAALFYVSELVLSPIFGVISDRLGHHRVMQFGPVFGMLAVLATWASTSLPIIAGTRLLEGAATASSVPSILGFIAVATASDEGLRGRASARFEAATLAGLLAGFAVAGFLWDTLHLGPATFLVNALIYGASFAIYRWGVDERDEGRAAPEAAPAVGPADAAAEAATGPRFDFGRYRRILGGSHVWLLAPTWIAINAVLGLYTTQTIFQLIRPKAPNPRFADQLLMGGYDGTQISIGVIVGGILFFAGLIYWGNRFKNLRRTTIILYGVGGGFLVVLGALGLNHSAGIPILVRLLFAVPLVFGVFVLAGATPAAIGLLADVTEAYPDDRGAIMGLYSVFLGLGQIIGSLIGGIAAEALGFDGILAASVVLLGIAVVPLTRLRRYEHFLGPGKAESLA
jgi:MFS family permease